METLFQPVFVIEFLAVGLGVLLGHQLSERRERDLRAEKEDNERDILKASLAQELDEIQVNISEWTGDLPPEIGFPTGSYQSGISGGRFILLDEGLQRDLNAIYGSCRKVL